MKKCDSRWTLISIHNYSVQIALNFSYYLSLSITLLTSLFPPILFQTCVFLRSSLYITSPLYTSNTVHFPKLLQRPIHALISSYNSTPMTLNLYSNNYLLSSTTGLTLARPFLGLVSFLWEFIIFSFHDILRNFCVETYWKTRTYFLVLWTLLWTYISVGTFPSVLQHTYCRNIDNEIPTRQTNPPESFGNRPRRTLSPLH